MCPFGHKIPGGITRNDALQNIELSLSSIGYLRICNLC